MNSPDDHRRIILLFDLDCFYAQCERVRLGMELDCSLALLQWDSVLAVTYPARKFGIRRGDSWNDVSEKSMGNCHAIHLHVLSKESSSEQENDNNCDDDESSLSQAYDKIYKLSLHEQMEARKELGVRIFHHQGKACLERYRIASMTIFSLVLETLTKYLGAEGFLLERASIDEFYLDITKYCYSTDPLPTATTTPAETVQVMGSPIDHFSKRDRALQRASHVSHLIRQDLFNTLGFTISAGISTNKTMAKLAASYGKPNGQALLDPSNFPLLLQKTKIGKVRNFGGKLGKQVLQLMLNNKDNATMGDLAQISLPTLQQHFSNETATFVYLASRGIDREAVKNTKSALVKSITAFKSFTATSCKNEIQSWIDVLTNEIVHRVQKDLARNKRYPKSLTLNYTYYTTPSGRRPNDGTHRSQRNTRSQRLEFPNPNSTTKAQYIKEQAMIKLAPILKEHPLRGVGLSANNFETRGLGNISSFFNKNKSSTSDKPTTLTKQQKPPKQPSYFTLPATTTASRIKRKHEATSASSQSASAVTIQEKPFSATEEDDVDKDLEMARKLQASFDREHYVLSRAIQSKTKKEKVRRIDSFFGGAKR